MDKESLEDKKKVKHFYEKEKKKKKIFTSVFDLLNK